MCCRTRCTLWIERRLAPAHRCATTARGMPSVAQRLTRTCSTVGNVALIARFHSKSHGRTRGAVCLVLTQSQLHKRFQPPSIPAMPIQCLHSDQAARAEGCGTWSHSCEPPSSPLATPGRASSRIAKQRQSHSGERRGHTPASATVHARTVPKLRERIMATSAIVHRVSATISAHAWSPDRKRERPVQQADPGKSCASPGPPWQLDGCRGGPRARWLCLGVSAPDLTFRTRERSSPDRPLPA